MWSAPIAEGNLQVDTVKGPGFRSTRHGPLGSHRSANRERKQEMDTTIQLGDEVRDSLTGFRGIAIGRCTWLVLGRTTIGIQSTTALKDGVPIDPVWFDEVRIVKL